MYCIFYDHNNVINMGASRTTLECHLHGSFSNNIGQALGLVWFRKKVKAKKIKGNIVRGMKMSRKLVLQRLAYSVDRK